MESNYFKLSNDVFPWQLDPYAFVVYSYLARCNNNKQAAFPSYKTIAEQCNISRRKAIDSVNLLEENKILKKDHRFNEKGENVSNTYKVVHNMHHLVQNTHYPSAQDAPNKELDYKEILDKEKEHKTAKQVSQVTLSLFEESKDHPTVNQATNIVKFYYHRYKQYTGKDHALLKEDQLNRVYDEIMHYLVEDEFNADLWTDIVNQHLDRSNRLGTNDLNINAFATERNLEIYFMREGIL